MKFKLGERVVIADPEDDRFGQTGYIVDRSRRHESDSAVWVRFETTVIRQYEEQDLKRLDNGTLGLR